MKIIKLLKNIQIFSSKSGQTLIELLLVMGISAIFLPALIVGIISSREGKVQQTQRIKALGYVKEAEEATRSVREQGWSTFAENGTYYPVINGSAWELTLGTETINEPTGSEFTRQVVISDVYRNTLSGPIVPQDNPGAVIDPSTKKVEITVSWIQPIPASIVSTIYLTRHLENAAYTETTQAHFNAGTKTGVTVKATSLPLIDDDGEVILGSGGNSDWCSPTVDSNTLDLPKNGVALSVSAIPGIAFVGTGENASGVSFAKVNVNSANPHVPTLGYTFDGYKTNGVFGNSNYGYLATDNNGKEVVIIDLNNVIDNKYQEAGYFNAPGNGSGNSVYIVGSTGYMITDGKLYNFNMSNMATCGSSGCPIIDSDGVALSGTGKKVVVVGSYAYVAIEGSTYKMDIIDMSNQANLVRVGRISIDSQDAKDIYVSTADPSNVNRAYLVTGQSSTQNEFFIIDISSKTSPSLVGSLNTSPMNPQGITVVPGNHAIIVGSGGEQYKVLDISNESNPSRCGGVTLPGGVAINGISSILDANNNAYSYIVIAQDPEFRIIEGGPGGGYAMSGNFESQTFNPGYSTANNRLSATFSIPPSTGIAFQVSLADLIGGNCPSSGSYTFVGPDGTSGTYFTFNSGESITFPFATFNNYKNPGQCMRYKAYLSTTNPNNTPVLNDVTINYSP